MSTEIQCPTEEHKEKLKDLSDVLSEFECWSLLEMIEKFFEMEEHTDWMAGEQIKSKFYEVATPRKIALLGIVRPRIND